MALTSSEISSRLFKKSLGYGETLTSYEYFNESYTGRQAVLSSQIWSQSDLIPFIAPTLANGASSGVVQYFEKLTLTGISGTNNKAYYSPDLIDAIEGNYGPGYNFLLYKNNGTTQIQFGEGEWLVDTSAGLLTFYPSGSNPLPSGVTELLPPKISFYKYIGQKGLSGISGGGTVSAGNGLTSSGSTFSVVVNPDSLEITSNAIRLKNTITGDRTFQDSVTIGGNLTVNGTVSYINTEQLYVEDNIIMLNATFSGTPTVNAGLEVNRGNQTNSTLLWDESLDLWTAGLSGSTTPIILNAGTGLTKSGATLSIELNSLAGTGLTQNGSQLSVNLNSLAGTGLTQNGSQLSVDSSTLAGSGLTSNGGVLSVNASNGLSIDGDDIVLGGTFSQDTLIEAYGWGLEINNFSDIIFTGTAASVIDFTLDDGSFLVDTNSLGVIDFYTGDLTLSADNLVDVNGSSINLSSSDELTINANTASITVSDLFELDVDNGLVTTGNGEGLVYTADYTPGFITHSLVTKGYVDDALSGVSVNAVLGITAGAGLTGGGTSSYSTISLELSNNSGLTFSTAGDDGTLEVAVDGTTIQINGSGELTVVAGASNPVYDLDTSALTIGDSQPTGVLLTSTPNSYSRVQVFINGQLQRLGDGVTTTDCYFSSDSGVTAKPLNSLSAGDELYWNGLVALFDLSVTDKIDIVYES